MKSVFSAVSCPSCAYCQKINFLCTGLKKTHCHGICRTSCCVYIIHHKYRKTRDPFGYLICIFQVLTPLYGIKFFLRSCASYLLYQMPFHGIPVRTLSLSARYAAWLKPLILFFLGCRGTGTIRSGFHRSRYFFPKTLIAFA